MHHIALAAGEKLKDILAIRCSMVLHTSRVASDEYIVYSNHVSALYAEPLILNHTSTTTGRVADDFGRATIVCLSQLDASATPASAAEAAAVVTYMPNMVQPLMFYQRRKHLRTRPYEPQKVVRYVQWLQEAAELQDPSGKTKASMLRTKVNLPWTPLPHPIPRRRLGQARSFRM